MTWRNGKIDGGRQRAANLKHLGLIMHFSVGEDVASVMLNLVQEPVLDVYKHLLEWKHTACVKSFWTVMYQSIKGQSKKWRFWDPARLYVGQTPSPVDAYLVHHFGGSKETALSYAWSCSARPLAFSRFRYSLVSQLANYSLILVSVCDLFLPTCRPNDAMRQILLLNPFCICEEIEA